MVVSRFCGMKPHHTESKNSKIYRIVKANDLYATRTIAYLDR